MPQKESTVKIGVLVHETALLGSTLLVKDILEIVNFVLGIQKYQLEFISYKQRIIKIEGVQLQACAVKSHYDYIIVSPLGILTEDSFSRWDKEIALLKSLRNRNTIFAASCLGVMLLARAGLLDDKQATTHWAWEGFAKKNFPLVNWNMQKMLCETSSVITAGGFLAIVDLVLSIIAKTSGKTLSRKVGKYLVADSIRENQSVYAMELITSNGENHDFNDLERWIDHNLHREISVQEMADRCAMSLRNFQRRFVSQYGIPPRRLLQLKRVQKARSLLDDQKLSIEKIVQKVGMSDVSAFRKIFQRELGMTLAEYRRRLV